MKDHFQHQPSQTSALNIARYKEAVIIALWAHVALVVCYVPRFIMFLEITHSKRKFFTYGRHFRNNGSCAVFNFHVEPVSSLLEDQSSKTSSKADK